MTASPMTLSPTLDPQSRRWLRLEGAAVFIAGAVAFGRLGGEFLWFVPLLLMPDLAIAGYLAGPRVGAFTYNLVHNWAFGLGVAGAGLALGAVPLALGGAVLVAHTGMDRTAGYGLKLLSGFGDTHLGRIGKHRSTAAPDATRPETVARPVAG